ncbi:MULTISPECIES: polysaccharide deacetylase family protein [unclassified Paenibacillus]|uniref:polysaccharide deacetylase family protein n=1 Tax=unclassified Paenibacillus TaxID=185978 RepID=UPI0030F97812
MKQQHDLARRIILTIMIVASIATVGTGKSVASSSEKMVALTFDDGPEKKYTGKVLDILKDNQVKGTFFVIGKQVKQYPDVMKRIAREGHELGNHSWSHPYLTKLNKEEIHQELLTTTKAIRDSTGITPVLMRPPYGAISDQVKKEINASGYVQALWNVDTRDWTGNSVAEILKTVKSNSSNKITLLMHSGGGNRDNTIKALPQIIDYYKSQGYTFVTMSVLNGLDDKIESPADSTDYLSIKQNSDSGDSSQSSTVNSASEKDVFLIFNQMKVSFPDAKPYVDKNNRVLAPLRFIAEFLNFNVNWKQSGSAKTITLTKDNLNVELNIGDQSAVVDGIPLEMDTAATILHDNTYVPLRFLGELIGMDIKWDSVNNTVTLSYKNAINNNTDEGNQTSETPILSAPRANVQQAKNWAKSKGATDVFIDLADIIWNEAPKAGVDPVVVYSQSAKETGYGKFGGVLDETFLNPAGLKTQSGGSDIDEGAHQRFFSWEEGVKAQIDHLALYAGAFGYPKLDTTDPRHFPHLMGKAVTVEALGGAWAGSPSYGVEIVNMMLELKF